MIKGERLDQLFQANNITPEYLACNILPPCEEEFEWIEEYGPDEDGYVTGGYATCDEAVAFENWIESLWDNDDLRDLLNSLTGLTDDEFDDIEDLEIDFSESKMISDCWDILYKDAEKDANYNFGDSMEYSRDPMGYYGVSNADFV